MASRKGIFVVAGVGNGTGTGASSARIYAKAGYKIAMIARNPDDLNKVAQEIKTSFGQDAQGFPIKEYSYKDIHGAFDSIKKHWPDEKIRVALWNAGPGVWKPFLDITEEDVHFNLNNNVVGAFAFSREAIVAFKDLPLNEYGARGTLIHTGATASLRGNKTTSAFAAGKFGLRALSQSLNKEFGKQNIHVAHAIIDGGILTDRSKGMRGADFEKNEDIRLDPVDVAKAYLFLSEQNRTAWTWELDLRPAHENW